MIIDYQVEQGSEAWHSMRRGVVTCSNFNAIMGTIAERNRYLKTLREPPAPFTSPATTWGKANEAQALAMYQLHLGAEVYRPGFMMREAGRFSHCVGGSPDGLILNGQWKADIVADECPPRVLSAKFPPGVIVGGVEIKCPYDQSIHVEYCRSGLPHRYLYQVLGYLWLTGAEFWDFVSFDPRNESQPLFVQRVTSSPVWMRAIEAKIDEFLHVLDSGAWFVEPSARAVVQSDGLTTFMDSILNGENYGTASGKK